MNEPASGARNLPAHSSVRDLASLLERDLTEIQAVLNARGEPSAPDDLVDAGVSLVVSKAVGVAAAIEPRDLALEHLYELETRGELMEVPGGKAGRLVSGVVDSLDRLDDQIEAASEHWSVARMPVVDRNILRLALYELREDVNTPTAIIVSEAVRLAHTYSTERSAAFVNGVLAALADDIRD